MQKVSFICVYNNLNQANELKNSILSILPSCDLVFIDNTKQQYISAASALNYGASVAKGDIFVFLHQDIVFTCPDDLFKFLKFIDENQKCLVGVAGARIKGSFFKTKDFISSITDPNAPSGYNSCKDLTQVQCLDECLFACKKDAFNEIGGFDAITFDGWHMYAVDLCLNAANYNLPVYVFPFNLIHLSGGSPNGTWYKYMNRVRKKYRKYQEVICCACGCIYTNWLGIPELWIYRLYRLFKRLIINV